MNFFHLVPSFCSFLPDLERIWQVASRDMWSGSFSWILMCSGWTVYSRHKRWVLWVVRLKAVRIYRGLFHRQKGKQTFLSFFLVSFYDLRLCHTGTLCWVTFSSSWYLVILCTGLIRAEEIELARPCLLWTSWIKQNEAYKVNIHQQTFPPFLLKVITQNRSFGPFSALELYLNWD